MISRLRFSDIKLKNIVFQHVLIISIGVLIFYVEKLEIASLFWEKLIVLVLALSKSVYFVEHSFRKIEEASLNNISYNRFLLVILTNVFLIIVSFTADYTCMHLIDPGSIKGMSNGSIWAVVFDAFYFSITSFTTVAFGDILPVSKSAKFLSIAEVIVAYITTIIIISNFVQIKDSIEKDK